MKNLIEEIDNILTEYQCKCYTFNKEDLILTCKGNCDHSERFNAVVAKITGLLMLNNITYDMCKDHHITITKF